MWFLVWLALTGAGFYFGGVAAGVVLALVAGLFVLLRSGRMKWS